MAKKAKRQYGNDHPSVTQIIAQLEKPALTAYFKKNTPEFIKEESAKALLIGEQLHQAICDHIELREVKVDTEYPEEIKNVLQGFMLFKKEHPHITLKRSEVAMTGKMYRYNGTLDCIADDNGEEVIFDFKTAKCGDEEKPPVYDEAVTQVAAYADLYNEIAKAYIDRGYVLSLAKDKVVYTLREVTPSEIGGHFTHIFLPLLDIWNYKHGRHDDDV